VSATWVDPVPVYSSEVAPYALPPTPLYQESRPVILSATKLGFDQFVLQKIAAVWAVTIIGPPCQLMSGFEPCAFADC
jgi:hypothetical protein